MLKAWTPSHWLAAIAVLGLVACGGDASEGTEDTDVSGDDASDGSTAVDGDSDTDTPAPDGGQPDSGTPDAEAPDTEVPDTEAPDTDPGVDGTMDTEDTADVDPGDADTVDADTGDAVAEDITPDSNPPDLGPSDAGADTSTGTCVAPNVGDLVINEVLPSPPMGGIGDSNCDGTRNAVDDEFVELMNASGGCLDLSGVYLLVESAGPQFTFPEGTELPADGAVVVFGGGTPTFDGTSTQTATQCINLVGCGVQFFTAAPGALALAPEDSLAVGLGESLLNSVRWGTGGVALVAGQSLTRVPARTGAFVAHATTSSMFLMSPGTGPDGVPFVVCGE